MSLDSFFSWRMGEAEKSDFVCTSYGMSPYLIVADDEVSH
jgi:hypothetical protein